MKKLLILTFDLIRSCDPPISLAAGYLLSRLKADPAYGNAFTVEYMTFNLLSEGRITEKTVVDRISQTVDLLETNFIAISCYIWCDYLVNDLIRELRDRGFRGAIILGGYQIYPGDKVLSAYPDADFYISGYAEEALISILTGSVAPQMRNLVLEPQLESLPSPYLDNTIPISSHQLKVRLETKRGCPYKCSFCGHRDLCTGKVYHHPVDKVMQELRYLAEKRPQKINIIDPVYNYGPHYLSILDLILNDLNLDILLSLQVRTELLDGRNGDRFLGYCKALHSILEIGLETIQENELELLNKKIDVSHIGSILKRLQNMQIDFEVNLIYGIPNQTLHSFEESIHWLQDLGCERINCNPMKLLPGTLLYKKASSLGLKIELKGPLDIPLVVASPTFNENDWYSMHELATTTMRKAGDRHQEWWLRTDLNGDSKVDTYL